MKIYQAKISDKHNDSYWYKGLIAENELYRVVAVGEIDLIATKEPENDEDLKNCEFNSNNWFEVLENTNGSGSNIILDNYDEVINFLSENEVN